jgi:phosphoglycolate phosphatase-like HAD superfamily hydrolase
MNPQQNSLKKIRAVIFDMDMTLINSINGVVEFYQKIAKRHYDHQLHRDDVLAHYGKPHREFVTSMLGKLDNADKLMEHVQELIKTEPVKSTPINQKINIIDMLYGKYKLGLLTSAPKASITPNLSDAGYDIKKFDFIYAAEDTDYHKPDSRVFDNLKTELDAYDIKANEILYVGDSLNDYFAAKDAGILFIAVSTGMDTKQQFILKGLNKSNIIKDLTFLEKILDHD